MYKCAQEKQPITEMRIHRRSPLRFRQRRCLTRIERRGMLNQIVDISLVEYQLAPFSLSARLRHYTGLHRTGPRLERLFSEFRFTAIREPHEVAAASGW